VYVYEVDLHSLLTKVLDKGEWSVPPFYTR
jgi:hypothetical protein